MLQTTERTPLMSTSPGTALIKTGLAVLPLYGILVGYATRQPQPDQTTDPEGWAQFVSSPSYLIEHVASGIIGGLIVIFGTFALGAWLANSRAPRLALSGMVLAVAGHILFLVPATVSTFATPAIGAAYLAGNREVRTVQFSPLLTMIFALALLLAVIGNVLLGLAIWRSGALPKWTGLIWIAATLIFYLLGAALGMATTGASLPTQPIGAALMAISSAWIAWTVLRRSPTQRRPGSATPYNPTDHVSNGV
jgi:hypothetical protein